MEYSKQHLYQVTPTEKVLTKDATQLLFKCHALTFFNRGTIPFSIGQNMKVLPNESYSVPDCMPPFVFTAQYNLKFYDIEDQYPVGGTAIKPDNLVQGRFCVINQIVQKE